jgi:hypothetical protein
VHHGPELLADGTIVDVPRCVVEVEHVKHVLISSELWLVP